jgi:hypothetical protein
MLLNAEVKILVLPTTVRLPSEDWDWDWDWTGNGGSRDPSSDPLRVLRMHGGRIGPLPQLPELSIPT